ncbi:helix-turn-helix domain-containing protein [Patescibacteria group bacterium]
MLKFYTLEQVAKLLKVHRTYVSSLIASGQIKAIKIGRSYRISESDLFEFLGGETKEVYTVSELAKLLQLHRNSIVKLINSKKLQGIKIGKLYRVTDQALENFLNSSGVK